MYYFFFVLFYRDIIHLFFYPGLFQIVVRIFTIATIIFQLIFADRLGSHTGDFSNNLIKVGSNQQINQKQAPTHLSISSKRNIFSFEIWSTTRLFSTSTSQQLFSRIVFLYHSLEYGIAIICFISISMQPMFNRINNMEYSYCLTVCEIFLPYWQ